MQQLTPSEPEILTGTMMDENGQPQTVSLEPQAINEAGDICGWYGAAGGPWGAFLLLTDGTLIDLPPLESKRYLTRSGNAYDLNDAVDPARYKSLATCISSKSAAAERPARIKQSGRAATSRIWRPRRHNRIRT